MRARRIYPNKDVREKAALPAHREGREATRPHLRRLRGDDSDKLEIRRDSVSEMKSG